MGCHTWFYKKIETPTQETIVNHVKEHVNKEIDFLYLLINDRESIDTDFLESYPEFTKEYGEKLLPIWQEILKFVDGKEIDYSIIPDYFLDVDTISLENLYCSWSSGLKVFIKDKGFYSETEFHDVFRKYGYPEDRLFSLEETLEYINNKENNCTIYDDTEDRLKEFWNKYPDGMIEFG